MRVCEASKYYCRFCGYASNVNVESCPRCGSSVPLKEWQMKAGDLVAFKNLPPRWGKLGLVTHVYVTSAGTGQIHMIAGNMPHCTIPWVQRDRYIKKEKEIRDGKSR